MLLSLSTVSPSVAVLTDYRPTLPACQPHPLLGVHSLCTSVEKCWTRLVFVSCFYNEMKTNTFFLLFPSPLFFSLFIIKMHSSTYRIECAVWGRVQAASRCTTDVKLNSTLGLVGLDSLFSVFSASFVEIPFLSFCLVLCSLLVFYSTLFFSVCVDIHTFPS